MKGITHHQIEALRLIAAADDPIDLDQLLPKLSWAPSKEAAQFTIRALVTKGMVEKLPLKLRRGRLRVSYQMTPKGSLVFDPRGPVASNLEAPEGEIPSLPGLSAAKKCSKTLLKN